MIRNLLKFLVVTTSIILFAFPLNSCFQKSSDEITVLGNFLTINSRLGKLNKEAKQTYEDANELTNKFSNLFDD